MKVYVRNEKLVNLIDLINEINKDHWFGDTRTYRIERVNENTLSVIFDATKARSTEILQAMNSRENNLELRFWVDENGAVPFVV